MKKPSLKYCGIHSLEDLKVTARSKADYLGFIFAESKRSVDPADVKRWCGETDTPGKKLVGVFVNENMSRMAEIVKDAGLDVIQLHGDETAADIKRLKSMTDCEIWKALPHGNDTVQSMASFAPYIDGYVIDSSVKGMRGGTGVSFSWDSVPLYIDAPKRRQAPVYRRRREPGHNRRSFKAASAGNRLGKRNRRKRQKKRKADQPFRRKDVRTCIHIRMNKAGLVILAGNSSRKHSCGLWKKSKKRFLN